MRTTTAGVNAALKAAGIDAEIVRGNGYFWFDGPSVERAYTTMVMVTRLGSLTVEQWVEEARTMAGDAEARG